jgi:RNA polymerase sigma factor (sigma-70 family)
MTPVAAPAVEDSELLRRYAEEGSEAAFAELVRRRVGLVYSVALRQTRGDRHRAEDATQAVFTDLARKARTLAARPILAGWLYRSAQFAAAGLVRAERRRVARELTAHLMQTSDASDEPEADWERIRPLLDEALNELDERDRDAIVLRFFDGRPFGEIGGRMNLSENAARMRVERALDRLQRTLAQRGVTSTATAVGLALTQQVTAAPAGLAATVSSAALAGSAGTGAVAIFMGITKLQVGIAAVVAVAGVTGYFAQARTNAALRREIAALGVPSTRAAALRAENRELAAATTEVEFLRHDDVELKQLEQQVTDVRQAQKQRSEQAAARAAARSRSQVLAEIQRLDQAATQEVDRLNREGNALVEEFKALQDQVSDPALTGTGRAAKEEAMKSKLQAIQLKQQQIQEFIRERRTTLNAMLRDAPPAAPGEDAISPVINGGATDRLRLRKTDAAQP